MGSRGAGSGRGFTAKNFEKQLGNYLKEHDGQLPRSIIATTTEQRNIVLEGINKLYKPSAFEKDVAEFAYIDDGRLKIPYGGTGFSIEGLTPSAIDGLKMLEAARVSKNIYDPVNNRDGALPELKYWKKRK